MTEQIITANTLREGAVVYLTRDEGWSHDPAKAWTATTAEDADRLAGFANLAEAANVVVGVELIPVEREGGLLRPVRNREQIRALGPTVRTDLGYQAEEEHDHVHL